MCYAAVSFCAEVQKMTSGSRILYKFHLQSMERSPTLTSQLKNTDVCAL